MIDLTKKYVTRSGRAVHLLHNRGTDRWPNVGFIVGENTLSVWKQDGSASLYDGVVSNADLVPAPEKINLAIWYDAYERKWRCCPASEQGDCIKGYPQTIAEIEVPKNV